MKYCPQSQNKHCRWLFCKVDVARPFLTACVCAVPATVALCAQMGVPKFLMVSTMTANCLRRNNSNEKRTHFLGCTGALEISKHAEFWIRAKSRFPTKLILKEVYFMSMLCKMFPPFSTKRVTSLYFPLRMFYQGVHKSGGEQVCPIKTSLVVQKLSQFAWYMYRTIWMRMFKYSWWWTSVWNGMVLFIS